MAESDLSTFLITSGLNTKFIGQNVIYLPVTTSTMNVAKEEARKKAPEGTVVIAEEQTLGRGRLKRSWIAPPGSGIAVSVILYPDVKALSYLIMVASLSVVESIRETTGLKAQIKWPNDVLLNGKKVCGILIENGFKGNAVAYAVIGIGINVNLKVSELPDISATATSLSDEMGRDVSRLAVVRNLLAAMEKLYLACTRTASARGFSTSASTSEARTGDAVFRRWRDNLVTLGRRVKVTSPDSVQEGVVESVSPDGSLMLRKPDGTLVKIVAEDVTLRE